MKGWQIPWEQFIIFVMILVGMACRCCGGWSTFGIGWEPQLDDLDGIFCEKFRGVSKFKENWTERGPRMNDVISIQIRILIKEFQCPMMSLR